LILAIATDLHQKLYDGCSLAQLTRRAHATGLAIGLRSGAVTIDAAFIAPTACFAVIDASVEMHAFGNRYQRCRLCSPATFSMMMRRRAGSPGHTSGAPVEASR
jgi:hypothetical protein